MITESLLLYTSATIPVGTSNKNTALSNTVPTSTSCNGFNCTILILYIPIRLKAICKAKEVIAEYIKYIAWAELFLYIKPPHNLLKISSLCNPESIKKLQTLTTAANL
jgi:hypothetical protein